MRPLHITTLLSSALSAQVNISVPLVLTGPAGERTITGIADPAGPSSAITVGHARSGLAHWCTATLSADTLVLSPANGVSILPMDGVLLRFIVPADVHGDLVLRTGAGATAPLVRPDGNPPVPGQLTTGAVAEVVRHEGRYVLSAPERLPGCPAGFSAVHQRLCIESDDVPGLNFHQSATRCARLGARLCTWDEYITACTLVGNQLQGLFDGWEWISGGSNHTQTGDQAGATDCISQRSHVPLFTGDSRCCLRP